MNPTTADAVTSPDDELSLIAIVDRYQGPLLAYAFGMLRDRAGAEDAVQETFLKLCHHHQTAGPAALAGRTAAWLFTVCRTRVIDMQRKRQPDSLESTHVPVLDHAPPPDAAIVDQEDHRRIAESIGDLSPRQQEVLQLRVQAGLSYREIAEVTGLSVSNVGFHLHAAVRALREQLVAP